MSSGLAGAATRGALWLGLVNLLSKGAQILVTLALGIFLTAADLGNVTITVALLNLGVVLQSVGVYDVIARTTEEPRRFAGTVATLSVGASTLIAVLAAGLAPQIASLAGSPASTNLLRVAALSLPFTAYAGVQMGYLHRALDFRRRLVPDAGSALAGAGVTIATAAAGAGAWSLVAGLMTTAVLSPLLGLAVGVKIPLGWSRAHARTVARWASITGPGAVLGLVLLNLDYVVVARALGDVATGVYSFAYRFAFVPYIMIAVVLGGVAFPVYARLMQSEGEDGVARALTRFVHAVVALTGGLYLGLALLADRIVVIDPRWAPSAPVLQVLTLYGLLLGLALTGYEALRASGRPGSYLRLQALHVVLLLVAALSLVRLGLVAMAWAQVLAVVVTVLLETVILARLRLLRRSVVPALLRPAGAAAIVALAHEGAAAAGLLPPASSLLGGITVGVLVLLAYAGLLLLVDKPVLRDVLKNLRRGDEPNTERDSHEQ